MAHRNFQVRFSRPVIGKDGAPLSSKLTELFNTYGEHLPALDLSGDRLGEASTPGEAET